MAPLPSSNPLYSDILDAWISEHKLRIKEPTAYNYFKALPAVKEYFDGVRIQDIDSEMVYNYVQHLQKQYTLITSTRLYCKVLSMSLTFAVRYGYIHYSPASDVKMPGRSRAEIKPFSVDEVYLLLEADGPQWVKDGIMIAFRTGMRPGEIYALKWTDINLDLRFISVQRAIARAGSAIKTTKTPSGVRRIDIDSKLVDYLLSMKKEKANQKCEYIFTPPPQGRHEYRVPWNLSEQIKRMCHNVGIPPRNFYALRHSHATLLLELGVHPKIVQERLGHHDIKVTLSTYSHVSPTIQHRAVEMLETV